MNDDMPVIFRYTRAQALEDRVLVDLTEWAREVGFRYPVACTCTVWDGFVVPPEAMRALGQSERGRAHDLLWMLFCAIKKGRGGSQVDFSVLFEGTAEHPSQVVTQEFFSVCGPGDQGEPVLTILLPGED